MRTVIHHHPRCDGECNYALDGQRICGIAYIAAQVDKMRPLTETQRATIRALLAR